jgi:two-component system LytT family response regulator
MQIKAVIIDDEQHSLETTVILVRKYCPGILVTGLADSPEKGIALIDALKPELVFLDIAMPRMNGFEMLQFIQFKNFEIVFTTAFDAYAIKAFKVNAMDYLLKPIEPEELIRAVEKVKAKIEKNQQLNRIDDILQNSTLQGFRKSKLALPVDGKIAMLEYDSILYCESDGNYTRIYLSGNKRLMISKTLKDIENMLPQTGFFRIHHSYVVNINHIKEYIRGEGGEVVMSNGEIIRVSRNKKEELLSVLFG